MPDLVCYIPNHGYSDDDFIYVSWLDANYYVSDKDSDSFKLATTAGGVILVQYTETIVDGFIRQIAGAGTTTISGLDHLEGEMVKVTAGGRIVATEIVSSGSITVPITLYTYQVGLPYKMKARTMRPSPAGTGNKTCRTTAECYSDQNQAYHFDCCAVYQVSRRQGRPGV